MVIILNYLLSYGVCGYENIGEVDVQYFFYIFWCVFECWGDLLDISICNKFMQIFIFFCDCVDNIVQVVCVSDIDFLVFE